MLKVVSWPQAAIIIAGLAVVGVLAYFGKSDLAAGLGGLMTLVGWLSDKPVVGPRE